MTNFEIKSILDEIEKKTNITSTTFSGWSIWSIIRFELAFFLRDIDNPTQPKIKKIFNWINWKRALQFNWTNIFINKKIKNKILIYTRSEDKRDKIDEYDKDVAFEDYVNALGRQHFVIIQRGNSTGLVPSLRNDLLNDDFLLILIFFYILSFFVLSPKVKNKFLQQLLSIKNHSSACRKLYQNINRNFYHHLRIFWATKKAYSIILRFLKVRGVLLNCSYGLGGFMAGFIAACQEAKIKTIECQHGIISPYHFGYMFGKDQIEHKKLFPIPNIILTYGKYWSRMLIENSLRTSDEIIEVGNPRINFWKNRIDLEKSNNMSMFITSQDVVASELIKFCEAIAKILSEENIMFRLIIKPHYNESTTISLWKKIEKRYSRHIKIEDSKAPNLFWLLTQNKLHGSVFSTVHYEAICLGIPTCIFKLPGWVDAADLFKKNIALLIETPQDCIDIIKGILTSKKNPFSEINKNIKEISEEYQEPNAIEKGCRVIQKIFFNPNL